MRSTQVMRVVLYLIAAINTLTLVGAISAKYIQHHQADMMAGSSGEVSVWMIWGCIATWLLGTVLLAVIRHREDHVGALIYTWWFIAGAPVALFLVGLFLFLLPAFL